MIPWQTVHAMGRLLEDGGLAEIEFEDESARLRLNRTLETAPVVTAEAPGPEEPTGGSGESREDEWLPVESPMVGTFYEAPAPDADPFVTVGDSVTAGTTVCIVEAMKLMNEIESEIDGTVRQVCKDDGEPVSQGDVLFYIEPA